MSGKRRDLERTASGGEVDAFLAKVAATPIAQRNDARRGRLLFAMDATASREPSWDRACHLQAEMFTAASEVGGLSIQLAYFRGFHEFHASQWIDDTVTLQRTMTVVSCAGGLTQIGRVLTHARDEAARAKVDALVYVGDCMEEDVDALCHRAGELSMYSVPAFVFQEGHDPIAERAFRQIAKITGGAYCRLDEGSAEQLRALLRAAAVYAAGGRSALERLSQRGDPTVKRLMRELG